MTPERWQRAKQLFALAIERDRETRDAFLAEECADDPPLGDEVRALLASDEQAQSFLEGAAPLPETPPLEAGQVLANRYRIVGFLASGGMSSVYLADDLQLSERVALKAIAFDGSGSDATERLRRETQLARMITHPNVCRILELGVHSEPEITFLTMEYVPGDTLADRLAGGALPVPEALSVARQMALALEAAHEQNVIHRDLKPANIKVTAAGVVKLLDFGLARLESRSLVSVSQTSGLPRSAGLILGTTAYMSPEQARGQPLDRRTDVWSFGCVLFELLSGTRAFRGDTVSDSLAAVLSKEPDWRAIPADVPGRIKTLLQRCLQKDKERRPPGIVAVRVEIELALAAGPRVAQLLRHRTVFLMTLSAAALVVALSSVSSWRRSERERWAQDVATPEITRLVDAGEFVKAAALTEEARRVLPNDPTLGGLWTRETSTISIHSEPGGADVSVRPYRGSDDQWRALGSTPIERVRVPKDDSVWRISKPGFATIGFIGQKAAWGADLEYVVTLLPRGAVPPDMVPVDQGETGLLHPLGDAPIVDTGQFLIDRHEVTNEQYKRFVDAAGYARREFWKEPFVRAGRAIAWEQAMTLFRDTTGRAGPATWEAGSYGTGLENHPVAGVSWYEAAAYAAFVGRSLPTIYHWTAASQADGGALWAPGSNFHGSGTQAVGAPGTLSGFTTTDMAGNVKEWCSNEGRNGTRFIMGGGFGEPPYVFFQSDARSPWAREPNFGFRCARVDEPLAAGAAARVDVAFRDYSKEVPVGDDAFARLRAFYDYPKDDLHARIEETVTTRSWKRVKVSFDAAYGHERMAAHLFLPTNAVPPLQAVMFFPPVDAFFLEHFSSAFVEDDLGFLLSSGRALVVPIYKATFERRDGLLPGGKPPGFFRDNVIMMAKDASRTLDYLETRSDIDSSKVAYLGDSLGAQLAPVFLATERRFKAAILTRGGFVLRRDLPEIDRLNFAPRVLAPVLMLNGRYDDYFPLQASQLPLFNLLGTPARDKKHVVYEAGHGGFPRAQQIRESLDWLDRYLGPVHR